MTIGEMLLFVFKQKLKRKNDIKGKYFDILCPTDDYPIFLAKYMKLPFLQRLDGVGVLCGTDWTPLYNNRFFYSRLEHSVGTALIIWNFTHDKAQTVAGLLHDVSTPVFSHASDFRKGDALTQTATESTNAAILKNDELLLSLLAADKLTVEQVENYHRYPVADTEIPQLSADRLEYMFPSGMILDDCWELDEIRQCYTDLSVLKNEKGEDELGFNTLATAELYCERFCRIGHILQLNENKLALQMLGHIMDLAEQEGLVSENDFMTLREKQVIEKLDAAVKDKTASTKLIQLYTTFRNMTKIRHTKKPLPEDKYYCVSLKVKQRYINPLVKTADGTARLYDISPKARKIIDRFLAFNDTPYGCVKLIQPVQ